MYGVVSKYVMMVLRGVFRMSPIATGGFTIRASTAGGTNVLTILNSAGTQVAKIDDLGVIQGLNVTLNDGLTSLGNSSLSLNQGWVRSHMGRSRRTATQAVTNSAALTADDTLTSTLVTGRNYLFYLWYAFTTVNTSGVQLDLNGGTATASAINGTTTIYSSAMATLNGGQITALSTAVGHTATGTLAFAEIKGSLACSGNGTFIPRFAQNAETGAAESVTAQIGSFMSIEED